MITNSGGGYSRWKDMDVTRWHEDSTCDDRGAFCYLRDVTSGEFWSTAYQPTLKSSGKYEAIFSKAAPSFAAGTTTMSRTRRSRFRPRTTSNCAG